MVWCAIGHTQSEHEYRGPLGPLSLHHLSNAWIHGSHIPSPLTFHSLFVLLGKVCRVGIEVDHPSSTSRVAVGKFDELARGGSEVSDKHSFMA